MSNPGGSHPLFPAAFSRDPPLTAAQSQPHVQTNASHHPLMQTIHAFAPSHVGASAVPSTPSSFPAVNKAAANPIVMSHPPYVPPSSLPGPTAHQYTQVSLPSSPSSGAKDPVMFPAAKSRFPN